MRGGIGYDRDKIREAATLIVAASNSLHPERADYVCDGTADNVEIQAALDALPTGGGRVILLEGRFAIAARLTVPSNTTLAGQGPSSVLSLDADVNDRFIVNSERVGGNSNIVIEDLYIDGNKDNQSAIGPVDDHGNAGCLDFRNVTNLIVKNCVIVNGWAAGIETTLCEHVICTGNRIDNSADDGIAINDQTFYATVSNNIINNAGQGTQYGGPNGIEVQDGAHDFSVTGNIIRNSFIDGIQVSTHATGLLCYHGVIANNVVQASSNSGIRVSGVSGQELHDITVMGNVIDGYVVDDDNSYYGIQLGVYSKRCTAIGNIIHNTTGRGIVVRGYDCLIQGNIIYDNTGRGIMLYDDAVNTLVARNILKNNTIPISNTGTNNLLYEQYLDLFMDVLAVSATHVVDDWDVSAAGEIELNPAAGNMPDVPRTLSWNFVQHTTVTEFDLVFEGVDAKGNSITETITEAAGWSGETSNAFATISAIKYTRQADGGDVGNIIDIGITDVLGLSNIIYETGDVYKIKKNNANAAISAAQVDTDYDTYDMAVIGLAGGDDFTCWFRSNLNIIS